MCLLVFSWKQSLEFPLLFIGNRDEFYERPTEKAHAWLDGSGIIAGQDKRAGGTWTGITQTRFAAITNIRHPKYFNKEGKSRGLLVTDALKSTLSADLFLENLISISDEYPGFNLIIGDRNNCWFFNSEEKQPVKLSPGIYGLSNATLNTLWPKVEVVKRDFEESLNKPHHERKEAFFNLMSRTETAPDYLLPDTGVGLELERILSAPFIISERYGTRSTTFISMNQMGLLTLEEKVFK